MFLIQILLPAHGSPSGSPSGFRQTRGELIEAFGGVTAYLRTPAVGAWISSEGAREEDEVVMVEVVARQFDRRWWTSYARVLATRFAQDRIHVRATPVDVLDEDAT